MFLLSFIRYLRGYVKFRVQGTFVERFLNLAARDHIPIWDGHKRGGIFTGTTIASAYPKLRKHAKKTGVTMRIAEKHGAPFKRNQYRKRTGLLVGLGIFFAFIFIMSRFIWRIEVTGNERVAESKILASLETIDVKPGKLRSSIDVRGAERRALLAIDELSWIALNIQGSTIHVKVRESEPLPDMVDPKTPCNVIASKSGQIESMVVYSGQSLKSIGDTVLEGDIVVSGITEDRVGQNLFKHARARIVARVQHQIIVDTPLVQSKFIETGDIRNRHFLQVFGWDLPLFLPFKIPQPYHVERSDKMLAVSEYKLPIGILAEKYFLMEEVPVTYTEDEAKLLSLKELEIRQKTELAGAEILDRTASGTVKDGVFRLCVDYICIMDIAREREILTEE